VPVMRAMTRTRDCCVMRMPLLSTISHQRPRAPDQRVGTMAERANDRKGWTSSISRLHAAALVS
jgi:hypothetical protein